MNEVVAMEKIAQWEKLKGMVLDSVSSPITKRVYNMALNEFMAWFQLMPRPGFTKATVSAWRVSLEERRLGSSSIIIRMSAIRKLAAEAADNGLLAPELAQGISRVKSVKSTGIRVGNWLSQRQAQALLSAPDISTVVGLRDRAILAVLLGCGLRRSEVAALTFAHVQQRDGRWCIVDLVGKHGRVRTAPMPAWVKVAIDGWISASSVAGGHVFRPVSRGKGVTGERLGEKVVWQMLKRYAAEVGVPGIAPHDLRRTCAKLEAVANGFRHGTEGDAFYKRALTAAWREAHRALKQGGVLAFTFHHDKDEPWIAVLESLFDAKFYLEATFPVRSDETKGEGSDPGTFGAQKVEYDVIHVCRKRDFEPTPVSWARMRREVLREVSQMAGILELHHKSGLPEGDLKVIKRGKALEYFSRHYGKVYVDEGKEFTVRDALIGINQLLDEASGGGKEPPPVNAEPMTRQFLRLFDGVTQQPRDQMQKLLRGTTIDPAEYEARGWCKETQKVYHLISPEEIAKAWYGKHRRKLTTDYDQSMVLIGASFPQSGINVMDTLNNDNFRPHPALGRLLKWHINHGATSPVRNAATIASQIYATWEAQNQDKTRQMKLFFDDGEEG